LTSSSPFAVVYPLPSHFASRILQDRKSLFVKYPTHETILPKLVSCKKLLLDISGSNKEIAWEVDRKVEKELREVENELKDVDREVGKLTDSQKMILGMIKNGSIDKKIKTLKLINLKVI